ncbi:hypothetical protein ES703_28765 [subsurface metagenome]
MSPALSIIYYEIDIIKTPSLRGELCYSSAALVDEASEARRHNKNNLTLLEITNCTIERGAG